jgi:hypothetical protein
VEVTDQEGTLIGSAVIKDVFSITGRGVALTLDSPGGSN